MDHKTTKEHYFKTVADKLNVTLDDVYTIYYGEEAIDDESIRETVLREFANRSDEVHFAMIWKGNSLPGAVEKFSVYDYGSQIRQSLYLYTYKMGYHSQLFFSNSFIADYDYFKRLVSKRPNAGFLVILMEDLTNLRRIRDEFQSPYILLNEPINTNIDTEYLMAVDNRRSIETTVSYLYELGHRRIAFIQGVLKYQPAVDRYEGYCAGLATVGLELDDNLVKKGNWYAESGHAAARDLLSQQNPPTAIIASNDNMAIGAMDAIKAMGLRIPDDVSVVGFDDIAQALQVSPTLTTVRVPLGLLGRKAAQKIVSLLDGEEVTERHEYVQTELMIRDSTGVAPA